MNEIKYQLRNIPIDQIDPGERGRQDYGSPEEMRGFCQSLRDPGQINAINVAPIEGRSAQHEKPYILLAGGRRLHAFRMLRDEAKERGDQKEIERFSKIRCEVATRPVPEEQLRYIEWTENAQRKPLNTLESAWMLARFHEHKKKDAKKQKKKWTVADTAAQMKMAPRTIERMLSAARHTEKIPDEKKEVIKNVPIGDITSALERTRKKKEQAAEAAAITKKFDEAQQDETDKAKEVSTLLRSYIPCQNRPGKKLYEQGFFEEARIIQDASQGMAEIDPPYGIMLQKNKKGNGELLSYNEVPNEDYQPFIERMLKIVYKKLRANTFAILWYPNGLNPDTSWVPMITKAIKTAGFTFDQIPYIWYKTAFAGQSMQPDVQLGRCYESFIALRKGLPTLQKTRGNVFDVPTVPGTRKIHPTERPLELMKELLETFCRPKDSVLVPFAGSGKTLVAAAATKRTAIGFDLQDDKGRCEYYDGFAVYASQMLWKNDKREIG